MSATNSELIKRYSKSFTESKAKEFMTSKKHRGTLIDGFKTLYRVLKCKNIKLSTSSKLLITGALAYVILPVDMVADYIPVAGIMDDIAVVSGVINAINRDLDKATSE
ncbi:MAG: YkvA family protein [Campylobacterales bacterium]